jgi:hypothetical protein
MWEEHKSYIIENKKRKLGIKKTTSTELERLQMWKEH